MRTTPNRLEPSSSRYSASLLSARNATLLQLSRVALAAVGLGVMALLWLAMAPSQAADQDTSVAATPASSIGVPVLHLVTADGYASKRTFIGRAEAQRSVELGFEQAGLLRELLVREGDRVQAGQLLARLDDALLHARREELASALASAEADLALAEATARRYRASIKDGAVTRQALDEASEGARAAAANVRLAEARIASIDLDLTKTGLIAPFDGTVIGRLADEGKVLGIGTPVLALQEDAPPKIRVGVAGPLADALRPGDSYRLQSRGGSFDARLRAVIPLRTSASRTVDALFEPIATTAAATTPIRPGELVELTLSERVDEPGAWLPLSALSEGERGLWRALVARPGDMEAAAAPDLYRLESRPLEVLYLDGDRAYVRGPLSAGEAVVSAGLHRVVPGQLVRVLEDASAKVAQSPGR
jgi:RND family efflux transporter MFP subunit